MTCQIVYHSGNCLNNKKPFAHACKLCIENCPHQAISEYCQLDFKLCTECGVCMAVCPSDGFVDQTMDQLYAYLLESEEVVLNCPQAISGGFEIPCLGIFDRDGWLSLMVLAKTKSVTIMTGRCAECEDRRACAYSVKAFNQIHADWPDHAHISIQVRPDKGSPVPMPETEKNMEPALRREEPTGWRKKSLKMVKEWLPTLRADETYPLSKARQFLLQILEICPEEKIPFPALTISDLCTNCGACVAICPQGALQKREEMSSLVEEDKENKILSLRLIWEPQKCVQCGRCMQVCKPQALKFSAKQLSRRLLNGKILLHEGSPRYCIQCGRRIFDNKELCLVCSTNKPKS